MMRRMRFLPLLWLFLSSCMGRYFYTDKELEEHFSHSPVKPKYQFFESAKGKVHAVQTGADTLPPVLFIHGAPGAWYVYMNLMEDTALTSHFRMVAVDRPGYGKSSYGRALPQIEDQVDALLPLLNELSKRESVIVVGRSYGAPIAAAMAARFPEKVRGLVLLAPAVDPDLERFWWFSRMGKWKVIRWMLPGALNVATDEKFAHASELRCIEYAWPMITQPVFVFQGCDDQIIYPQNAGYLEGRMPSSHQQIVFIDSCDHLVSNRRPDLVKSSIFNVLRLSK